MLLRDQADPELVAQMAASEAASAGGVGSSSPPPAAGPQQPQTTAAASATAQVRRSPFAAFFRIRWPSSAPSASTPPPSQPSAQDEAAQQHKPADSHEQLADSRPPAAQLPSAETSLTALGANNARTDALSASANSLHKHPLPSQPFHPHGQASESAEIDVPKRTSSIGAAAAYKSELESAARTTHSARNDQDDTDSAHAQSSPPASGAATPADLDSESKQASQKRNRHKHLHMNGIRGSVSLDLQDQTADIAASSRSVEKSTMHILFPFLVKKSSSSSSVKASEESERHNRGNSNASRPRQSPLIQPSSSFSFSPLAKKQELSQSHSSISIPIAPSSFGRRSISYSSSYRSNPELAMEDSHERSQALQQYMHNASLGRHLHRKFSHSHNQQQQQNSQLSHAHSAVIAPSSLSRKTSSRGPSLINIFSASNTNSGSNTPHRTESHRLYSSFIGEPVRETRQMVRDYDPQTGNKMVNNYMVIRELGRGFHGKVKLCVDVDTGEKWAVKVVEKTAKRRLQNKLSAAHRATVSPGQEPPNPQLEKIKREIAILKKCSHPHVVRLREVIDDPQSDKVYLVLEYLEGGEVVWQDGSDPPKPALSVDEARSIFRDLVCGVQYLHYQGIVHRDIKPANLLWTADHRVKISDFGVSVFVGRKRRRPKNIRVHSSTGAADKTDIARLRYQQRQRLEAIYKPSSSGSSSPVPDASSARYSRLRISGNNSQNVPRVGLERGLSVNSDAVHADLDSARDESDRSDVFSGTDFSSSARASTRHENTPLDDMPPPSAGTEDDMDDDDDEEEEETDELELAKTAGSPAFFAPELCGMGELETDDVRPTMPPITVESTTKTDALSESKTNMYRGFNPFVTPPASLALPSAMHISNLSSSSSTGASNDKTLTISTQPDNTQPNPSQFLSPAGGAHAVECQSPMSEYSHSSRVSDTAQSVVSPTNIVHPHRLKITPSLIGIPPSSMSPSNPASDIASITGMYASSQTSSLSRGPTSLYREQMMPVRIAVPGRLSIDYRKSPSWTLEDANDSNSATSAMPPASPQGTSNSMNFPVMYQPSQTLQRPERPMLSRLSLDRTPRPLPPSASLQLSSVPHASGSLRHQHSYASTGQLHPNTRQNSIRFSVDESVQALFEPPIGAPIDIWAMGVTLFCLIFGSVPFIAETEFELFNVIIKQPLVIPDHPVITSDLRDLLYRLLEKDPVKRITLEQVRRHAWVTADLSAEARSAWFQETDPSIQYCERLKVSDDEVSKAVTIMDRIRDHIRKLSHSFHNLAAGLSFRKRTASCSNIADVDGSAPVQSPNGVTNTTTQNYSRSSSRSSRKPLQADTYHLALTTSPDRLSSNIDSATSPVPMSPNSRQSGHRGLSLVSQLAAGNRQQQQRYSPQQNSPTQTPGQLSASSLPPLAPPSPHRHSSLTIYSHVPSAMHMAVNGISVVTEEPSPSPHASSPAPWSAWDDPHVKDPASGHDHSGNTNQNGAVNGDRHLSVSSNDLRASVPRPIQAWTHTDAIPLEAFASHDEEHENVPGTSSLNVGEWKPRATFEFSGPSSEPSSESHTTGSISGAVTVPAHQHESDEKEDAKDDEDMDAVLAEQERVLAWAAEFGDDDSQDDP